MNGAVFIKYIVPRTNYVQYPIYYIIDSMILRTDEEIEYNIIDIIV